MNRDCLKLTAYLGERDRAGGAFLADRLLDLFERHELAASVLLRGAEGFGMKHQLRTQRLLTLSEDLPVVAMAVDARAAIEPLLSQVEGLMRSGLLTVERARLLAGRVDEVELRDGLHGETKLTVWCGRGERAGGRPAPLAIVDALRRHGVAGATVLVGVDGTAHGRRRRGRFLSRNAHVPALVVAVGGGDAIARALAELDALLVRPLATVERVRVCKRDGRLLAEPDHDHPAAKTWQKLTVYAGEQSRHAGRPLHVELVRRLREAGAAGATALRGTWGYHGDHEPHGDRLLALARRVPVVTVVVDRSEPTRRWWRIVDELTDETGLVTSERVPAVVRSERAPGPSPSS